MEAEDHTLPALLPLGLQWWQEFDLLLQQVSSCWKIEHQTWQTLATRKCLRELMGHNYADMRAWSSLSFSLMNAPTLSLSHECHTHTCSRSHTNTLAISLMAGICNLMLLFYDEWRWWRSWKDALSNLVKSGHKAAQCNSLEQTLVHCIGKACSFTLRIFFFYSLSPFIAITNTIWIVSSGAEVVLWPLWRRGNQKVLF